MHDSKRPLHLFEGYGIEMEYMLVQQSSLNIAPIADKLLAKLGGTSPYAEPLSTVACGEIAWSNELVAHVIEMKTNGPAPALKGLAQAFQKNIGVANAILHPLSAKLLPTGAHPWMSALEEMVLWPYGQKTIYETYHRIFNCQGHGWANLQSTHLNLPFANDEEFGRLHTAIRFLLPLMPGLSASTPILDRKPSGWVDTRLHYYASNQAQIPSITGWVIPELVWSQREYQQKILDPMYQAISSYDSEGVLQEEWLNSRGAIARFDRQAIEIRILDIQENPRADIAIIALIVSVLKALVYEEWGPHYALTNWSEKNLYEYWLRVCQTGQAAIIDDKAYLRAFGLPPKPQTVQEIWQQLYQKAFKTFGEKENDLDEALIPILTEGNLAERILRALQGDYQDSALYSVYRELGLCLAEDRAFKTGIPINYF